MSSEKPYRSSLRDEQARQTRLRIRQAARELYAAQGFNATTIAEIAARAGVSPATVYAVFESKAGLVVAMLEDIEEGVGIGDHLELEFEDVDPRRQLRRFLTLHCDLFESSSDILRAAMRAIEDPEVAAFAAEGDSHRRRAIDGLTSSWEDAGALREGVTAAAAADRLWLLTTVEGYLNAVDRLGWSRDEYEAWLADLAETELFDPEQRP